MVRVSKKHDANTVIPLGAGKTTISKKFNKNIKILKYQFLTLQEKQDQMK